MSKEPYTEPPDYSAKHGSNLQLYNSYLELRVQDLSKQVTGLNEKVAGLNKLLDKPSDARFELNEEDNTMSEGTYSHSNRHRMHEKRITRDLTKEQVSKFNFLGNELQVTNSDELAVHVYKGLANSRLNQIIKLEDENYELRKMLDKAFDAGFEFDEEES